MKQIDVIIQGKAPGPYIALVGAALLTEGCEDYVKNRQYPDNAKDR